ncbi:hypothetical protein [Wolbachia endosymbiont of Litomosoides sigmodontis]|nr:hypothetical protein [Wolbachia endosymbiont of Litomosoides sigmodontis]
MQTFQHFVLTFEVTVGTLVDVILAVVACEVEVVLAIFDSVV